MGWGKDVAQCVAERPLSMPAPVSREEGRPRHRESCTLQFPLFLALLDPQHDGKGYPDAPWVPSERLSPVRVEVLLLIELENAVGVTDLQDGVDLPAL